MKLESGLIIPDVHIPYHDPEAWGTMLEAGHKLKPKWLVTMGDFADCFAVSDFDKSPERALDLQSEIDAVNRKLTELDKLGAGTKIYVEGNHEYRLERYLMKHAPALFRMLKIRELFELDKRGWIYVPYKHSYKLGKLHLTHDVGTAGQNAHRQAMDAFQGSVVIGHTHRLEVTVKGNADGPPQIGAMFGWLGDFEAIDYMHRIQAKRNWVHGFGIGYKEPSGVVHLQACPIVKGRVAVQGEMVVK